MQRCSQVGLRLELQTRPHVATCRQRPSPLHRSSIGELSQRADGEFAKYLLTSVLPTTGCEVIAGAVTLPERIVIRSLLFDDESLSVLITTGVQNAFQAITIDRVCVDVVASPGASRRTSNASASGGPARVGVDFMNFGSDVMPPTRKKTNSTRKVQKPTQEQSKIPNDELQQELSAVLGFWPEELDQTEGTAMPDGMDAILDDTEQELVKQINAELSEQHGGCQPTYGDMLLANNELDQEQQAHRSNLFDGKHC
jgi:hypothetical protein